MAAAASGIWKYADPDSHDLRHALATHHGVAPAQVMVGEGIDALLGLAVRLFLAPGEAVPPGIVLLLGGVALAVLGMALIVLVLRMLLAQAVTRDIEATRMRAELAEVI